MTSSVIDVNVSLSRWPTRRIRNDETHRLAETLSARGVGEAWAGSFDGLLHRDIDGVNARLAEECGQMTMLRLVPFGSVNPQLPDWEEDVRRCAEVYGMPGIRLTPNYHGYTLDSELFGRVLQAATASKLIVGVVIRMEDERMMHPLLTVKSVSCERLARQVRSIPGLRLIVHNSGRTLRGEQLSELMRAGEVYTDIAFLEGVGALEELMKESPPERILFGSHAPFHYVDACLLKLEESELAQPHRAAILRENAARLLPAGRG